MRAARGAVLGERDGRGAVVDRPEGAHLSPLLVSRVRVRVRAPAEFSGLHAHLVAMSEVRRVAAEVAAVIGAHTIGFVLRDAKALVEAAWEVGSARAPPRARNKSVPARQLEDRGRVLPNELGRGRIWGPAPST